MVYPTIFVRALILCTTVLFTVACGTNNPNNTMDAGRDGSNRTDVMVPDSAPVPLNPGEFTYTLMESPANLPLWTTPATHKIESRDRPPTSQNSGLNVSAARNEFEPFQLALGPATAGGPSRFQVDIEPFSTIPNAQITMHSVGYEMGFSEHLTSLTRNASVTLSTTEAKTIWFTVYVPRGSMAGDHTTNIVITPENSQAIRIPVRLHVFNFDLPDQIHFDSQYNLSISDLIPQGGTVDDAKTLLYNHRMTPASVPWPSGFSYEITWDNSMSTTRCQAFWDEPTEPDMYAIRWLGPRYLLGTGWNNAGFPSAMVLDFVNNSTPRPDTFCGQSRGDHYGTSAYNTAWSQYLTGLQNYLQSHGMIDRAYYYIQNEPQNDEDHRLANHLCRLTRQAAPQLRIAVSEEPTPAIAERTEGACGYDIWIAHVRAFEPVYAATRQRDHNEDIWFYSLDHDPDPYFNPTRVDHQGIHQRIIPWVSWKYRARGFAYYDAGRFFDGPQPTIRAELFREGHEDYEYLFLANNRTQPTVDVPSAVDPTVASVASSLTSWTRDADALASLRHQLGLYIEGARTTVPTLQRQNNAHPRGTYNINFQNPTGRPTQNPLVINGQMYIKVGWQAFNDTDHYGWSGENIGNPAIALFGYDDVAGFDEAQKSYIYDDYGRDNLFEFELENGRYQVTIGVGRPARGYPNDPHNVMIEGMMVVNDEVTTTAMPTITRTVTIDLADGSLSLVAGGRSRSTGQYSYTFLQFMRIVPAP